MSGEGRELGEPGDSTPDFDARWRELAAELGQSLPPDLQEWAGSQDPASPPQASVSGHVVWAGGLDGEGGTDRATGAGTSDSPSNDPSEGADDAAGDRTSDGLSQHPGTGPAAVYGPRDWSPPPDAEHFEPPDPPPVLAGDPLVVMGWLGLLGGLAVIFVWAVLGSAIPAWLSRAGLVAIVAGAAVLVWKMPHHRSLDDSDDGAQP